MSPPRLGARLAAATLLVACVLLGVGPTLIGLLAPPIAAAADLLSPFAIPRVEVVGELPAARVEARARVLAPVAVGADAYVPPATTIGPVSLSLVHALVPPGLLAIALVAWPCGTVREALRRIVLAGPAIALVVVVTVAPHLAGLFDAVIGAHRMQAGEPRAFTAAESALLFLEGGGRWLVAIVAAVACVAAARQTPRARLQERPAPVDPALVGIARAARGQARPETAVDVALREIA